MDYVLECKWILTNLVLLLLLLIRNMELFHEGNYYRISEIFNRNSHIIKVLKYLNLVLCLWNVDDFTFELNKSQYLYNFVIYT